MFALLVSVRPQSCQALRWVWNQEVKPWCRRPSTFPLLCPTERFSGGQATATYSLTTPCYHISPVLATQIQLQANTYKGKYKYNESTPRIIERKKTSTLLPTPLSCSIEQILLIKKQQKYECNEKGRDLTQKEQKMQGERLITKRSPILPLTKAKWCIYANMWYVCK